MRQTGLVHDGDVERAADAAARLQSARFHKRVFETRNLDGFEPLLNWRRANDK